MQLNLQLPHDALETLHAHAEKCRPLESAALLLGRVSHDTVLVTRAVPVRNVLQSRTSFQIDPEEEYRLILEAEEHNEEIVGIFHSHPAPPAPSSRDLGNMRLNPVVWLIASKQSGRWVSRAFVLSNGEAQEVQVTTET